MQVAFFVISPGFSEKNPLFEKTASDRVKVFKLKSLSEGNLFYLQIIESIEGKFRLYYISM